MPHRFCLPRSIDTTVSSNRLFPVLCVVLLTGTFLLPKPASAQVEQVSLVEMIASAGTIFSGTVLDVEGLVDERGNIVTRTTFRVDYPVRGVLPGTHTITQYGGHAPEGSMVLAHMRYFSEGERVFVLLYPPSELGYTSPIGMGQGAWGVDREDRLIGVDRAIFEGVEQTALRYEAMPDRLGRVRFSAMLGLVRSLALAGEK